MLPIFQTANEGVFNACLKRIVTPCCLAISPLRCRLEAQTVACRAASEAPSCVRSCCCLIRGHLSVACAGLGPDPYSMRRSEQGALAGTPPGAGPGSMLRSRSHSILPAAPRTVSRRRLGSQAGLTGSSEEGIPGVCSVKQPCALLHADVFVPST